MKDVNSTRRIQEIIFSIKMLDSLIPREPRMLICKCSRLLKWQSFSLEYRPVAQVCL